MVDATIVEDGVTLTALTDFEIDKATGIIIRISNDRPAHGPAIKITITYSAGHDLPAGAPPALAQACIQLVKSYFVGSERDPMLRSESVDALSSSSFFDGELPDWPAFPRDQKEVTAMNAGTFDLGDLALRAPTRSPAWCSTLSRRAKKRLHKVELIERGVPGKVVSSGHGRRRGHGARLQQNRARRIRLSRGRRACTQPC